MFMTTLALLLVLALLGFVVDRAYRHSLEAAVRDDLQDHIYNLIRVAEEQNGQLNLPAYLQEQRLNQPGSGLVAWMYDDQGQLLWRSLSGAGWTLPVVVPGFVGESRFAYAELADHSHFVVSYTFEWEMDSGELRVIGLTLLSDKTLVDHQLEDIRLRVFVALLVLALLVLGLQAMVLFWGLLPLRRLARQLNRVERGEQACIEGVHPREMTRLVDNLNVLLSSLRRQNEQYQHRMADLAHGLKTPLAVIYTQLNKDQQAGLQENSELKDQLDRIDQMVAYQLQRSIRPDEYRWRQSVEVKPILEKILRSLDKVYRDKAISVDFACPEQLRFYGDERDFYEIVGNVLDNAFKAANKRISVRVQKQQLKGSVVPRLSLDIADDGSGIAEHEREGVLARGARLDTLQAGQGIGLAVVTELVESYDGRISISQSADGGACFHLLL
jgi:two-component system sensor histidine kinase PhoQ